MNNSEKDKLKLFKEQFEAMKDIYEYKAIALWSYCGLCGCGSSGKADRLLEVLKWTSLSHEDKFKLLPSGLYTDRYYEFCGHILDHFGLIDHGGSICSSWITDSGKELLEFLSSCDLPDYGGDEDDILFTKEKVRQLLDTISVIHEKDSVADNNAYKDRIINEFSEKLKLDKITINVEEI